jgi:hypothetical protein
MVRSFGPATGKDSLLRECLLPLTIEVCNETGEVAYAYHLFRCRVAEYRAIANPDASASEIAIGHLEHGFENWERDPPEEESREKE